jgi:hypothetical protein
VGVGTRSLQATLICHAARQSFDGPDFKPLELPSGRRREPAHGFAEELPRKGTTMRSAVITDPNFFACSCLGRHDTLLRLSISPIPRGLWQLVHGLAQSLAGCFLEVWAELLVAFKMPRLCLTRPERHGKASLMPDEVDVSPDSLKAAGLASIASANFGGRHEPSVMV